MRILNVTAQKPNSTGSGIFLSGLMTEFANKGHTQALVAGVYPEEETPVPDRVTFYPVYFEQGKLNFPIVGMSDEMPYPSTRYRDMTPKMEAAFKESFLKHVSQFSCMSAESPNCSIAFQQNGTGELEPHKYFYLQGRVLCL